MKITECHNHPRGGVFLADDGTKFYWREGRGKATIAIRPDGTKTTIDGRWPAGELADAMREADQNPQYKVREMTPAEEAEWDEIRG